MTSDQAALQRGKVLGMVLMGCELDIAAHTVGWTEEQLKEQCQNNLDFAAELALKEGSAELHHMRNVYKAAEDVKNWRASTWWLARRAADRRERKKNFAVTLDDLCGWVQDIVEMVWAEVRAEEDRERLTNRLLAMLSAEDRETVAEIVGKEDFDLVRGNASTKT